MRIKARHILDKVKQLKGNKNINPINKVNEGELPHISTAPQDIQNRWEKMVDRGDHPEQAANRLGHTTNEPKPK